MNNTCRQCGKEMEARDGYCPHCAASLGAVKTGKIWLFAIIFSALLLVLAGLLLWSGNCCKLNISQDGGTRAVDATFVDSSTEAAGFAASGGGCCGVGDGDVRQGAYGCGTATPGCGGSGVSVPLDAGTEKRAKEAALEAYAKTRGNKKGLKARVSDYGCHIQVDIEENGKPAQSYTYRNGDVYEI